MADLYRYFMPLIGGAINEEQERYELISINTCYGTCSYIKNNMFISAGHSIRNASEHPFYGIGFANKVENKWSFKKALDFEVFEDLDLGLIKLEDSNHAADAFSINPAPLSVLDDVSAVGYPHSIDRDTNNIVPRGFKGNIVSANRPFHTSHIKAFVYELSFGCPKGISGAPIIFDSGKLAMIHGYIIGNAKVQMSTGQWREITKEGNKETVYQVDETFNIGIAVVVNQLLNKKSRILGKTVGDYLKDENLM